MIDLEKICEPLVRSKRCWFWHTWMKWEVVERRIMPQDYVISVQHRSCLDCGLNQEKTRWA